MSTMRSTRR